jgi:hypothetical protein
MADVIQNTQQEFWRPPTVEASSAVPIESLPLISSTCSGCGAEFMIGSRFCHACGVARVEKSFAAQAETTALGLLEETVTWVRTAASDLAPRGFYLPRWLRYLHFHEIKRWVGLPTAAFVAFMVGVGCVAGAIGVGLVYKASNLSEFQAVQLWRIEWLVAATAAFVAGILLKKTE